MKPTLLFSLFPLLIAPSVSAWYFDIPSQGYTKFGSSNKGCTPHNIPEGTHWWWDRDPSENCCLRLYANSGCNGDYIGWTCDNLDHASTNYMRAWKVTNC